MHESADDQFSSFLQKVSLSSVVQKVCNCHDVSGFISVKFPEQMNALLELSLGRHER